MLKKIFIKNGIIMIPKINNIEINYNIINKKHNKENAIKEYYKSIGCNYDKIN